MPCTIAAVLMQTYAHAHMHIPDDNHYITTQHISEKPTVVHNIYTNHNM